MEQIEGYKELLKKRLTAKRYTHTVSVAQTAAKLAKMYEGDADQAYLAGLLHDYARDLSPTELLTIAQENELLTDHVEVVNPDLLHGVVGAFLLRQDGLVTDEVILRAIRYHTTGHPQMDKLGRIIYIADYIEPGRTKQPHLEELRSIALSDLDMLTFRILEDTVEYLKAKSLDCIDDNTITAYNFYKKLIEER